MTQAQSTIEIYKTDKIAAFLNFSADDSAVEGVSFEAFCNYHDRLIANKASVIIAEKKHKNLAD